MYRSKKNDKDVTYILDNLRMEDLLELKALWGENWREETLKNIMGTDFYVMLGKTKNKDVPVVMGGVWEAGGEDKGIGCAWLLSTEEVSKHSLCLLKELKKEMERADEKYWLTYNFIYKENWLAKKWLSWLGYKFDNPRPEGMNIPKDFEFFYRLRPVKGLGE